MKITFLWYFGAGEDKLLAGNVDRSSNDKDAIKLLSWKLGISISSKSSSEIPVTLCLDFLWWSFFGWSVELRKGLDEDIDEESLSNPVIKTFN